MTNYELEEGVVYRPLPGERLVVVVRSVSTLLAIAIGGRGH